MLFIWLVPIEKLQAQDPYFCELDFTLTPIGLCGDELGEIAVDITGGFGKYKVDWVSNNNSINESRVIDYANLVLSDLPTGFFSFRVTDEFSKCSKVLQVLVDFNFLRGDFKVTPNAVRCSGVGSVSFDITGNTPPYELTVDGPISKRGIANSNRFKIYNLPMGDYVIKLEKGECRQVFHQTVGVKPGLPNFDLVEIKDDCGINIGAVDAIIQDGKGPYSLSWEGPTTGSEEVDNSVSISGLATGGYKFTLEDAEGCQAFHYLEVNTTSLAVSAAKVADAINGGRGFVKLAIQGGVPGYAVTWDGLESGERESISRDEVISLPAGTVDIEVTDGAGCSEMITVTIAKYLDAIGLADAGGHNKIAGTADGNIMTDNKPLVYQNYPNPFSNQTVIQFELPTSTEVELLVHDHFGRLVMSKSALFGEGPQQFDINGGDLAAGMFFYTIVADEFKVTKRMVVR